MSTDTPYVVKNHIYFESFEYKGSDALPGSGSLPEQWSSAPEDSFTTKNSFVLNVLNAGELIYQGDSLSTMQIRNNIQHANYAIGWLTVGRENAKIELRIRRLDEHNFISVLFDFENQLVSIQKTIAGVKTVLNTTNYHLVSAELTVYDFAVHVFNEQIYAYINNSQVLFAECSELTSQHGFSLNIPEFNENDPLSFTQIYIQEIIEQPDDEQNNYDLFVIFRRLLKHNVESTTADNYNQYKRNKYLWNNNKSVGLQNDTWSSLGIPIQEPETEQYFGED